MTETRLDRSLEDNIFNNPVLWRQQNKNLELPSILTNLKFESEEIQEAREIFGEVAKQFDSEQMQKIISEISYLAESWLDDWERDLFDGKTLNELLTQNRND